MSDLEQGNLRWSIIGELAEAVASDDGGISDATQRQRDGGRSAS